MHVITVRHVCLFVLTHAGLRARTGEASPREFDAHQPQVSSHRLTAVAVCVCACVSVCMLVACVCVGGFLCDAYFQPSRYKEGDNQKTVSDREDDVVGQVARQHRNSGGVQRGMPTIDKSHPLSVQVPHRQGRLHCRPAAPCSPFLLFCLLPNSQRWLLMQYG